MRGKVVEIKSCKQCDVNFNITDLDIKFHKKMSPEISGEVFSIPSPTLCPDCRQERRLVWINERNLYKRKCSATGKEIISMYSPDKEYVIYDQNFWWGDKWSLEMSELDFDFSKSFFSQFLELTKVVPKRALVRGTGSENCDYANYLGGSKDSYLVFYGDSSISCMYLASMSDTLFCNDGVQLQDCTYCYESIDVIGCHNCFYIQDCLNCNFSHYLLDCVNCTDCFGCVGLHNKSYCIFNKEYSKEDYNREKARLIKKGYSRKFFLTFSLKFPRLHHKIIGSENISGDIIFNSKNVHLSYEIYDAEDVSYSTRIYRGAHDCMDVNVGLNNSNNLYEVGLANGDCINTIFTHDCWNSCANLMYCTECKNSKNCFGCTGLIGKEYCILNKQFTPDEYEKQVAKIINQMKQGGEWGEFFPSSISPFGYNETKLMDFSPLKKEEAVKKGWNWSDYSLPIPKADKVIPASKLPQDISDIPDDILNWAIKCEITGRPFKVIPQELEFYRKHNLPIPKRHPDQRHLDRMKLRNPRKLYERKCDKCSAEITSTYSSNRKEIVYCEKCYNEEVY